MNKFRATLYWTRHGYSCANWLQDNSFLTWTEVVLAKDTLLSDTGVMQAVGYNNFLKKEGKDFDIIVCSKLRRAVETALFSFNDDGRRQVLYVVPFINEGRNVLGEITGYDASNIPSSTEDLKKYLNGILPRFNIEVNYDFVDKFEDENIPSYDNFMQKILPGLQKLVGKDDFDVGIVSHSLTMIDNMKKNHGVSLDYKYKNLETWFEKTKIDIDSFGVKYGYEGLPCGKSICKFYDGGDVNVKDVDIKRCKYHKKVLYGGNIYHREYVKCKREYIKLKKIKKPTMTL